MSRDIIITNPKHDTIDKVFSIDDRVARLAPTGNIGWSVSMGTVVQIRSACHSRTARQNSECIGVEWDSWHKHDIEYLHPRCIIYVNPNDEPDNEPEIGDRIDRGDDERFTTSNNHRRTHNE